MVRQENYKVRNEDVRDNLVTASIEDKIRENRLILFGHICRRPRDQNGR